MMCHSLKPSLNLVLNEFDLSYKNKLESDLLTNKKRSVMGLKMLKTPSQDFRSIQLNSLPINRAP